MFGRKKIEHETDMAVQFFLLFFGWDGVWCGCWCRWTKLLLEGRTMGRIYGQWGGDFICVVFSMCLGEGVRSEVLVVG